MIKATSYPTLLLLATLLVAAGCQPAVQGSRALRPDPLAGSTQLIVITTPDWNATSGMLRRFSRESASAPWRAESDAVPVVVGRNGLAWGYGIDATGPKKREGDGRSPAGVFALGKAFGFDAVPSVRMPYLQLTPSIECVDDRSSVVYNQVVDRSAVLSRDWRSSERMREIPQYQLGIIVDYNPGPAVRGAGSCIFLHIWNGPGSTTSGCTAMDAEQLRTLMAWLEPRARPMVVQVPVTAYHRMAGVPEF